MARQYWNLLSQYIMAKNITVLLYIMIFLNYAMECIIVVDKYIATHCMKYIFRLLIIIICSHYIAIGEHIVFDKQSLLTGL